MGAFVGFSAWIAALLLIGFLALTNYEFLLDMALVLGLGLAWGAVVLNRAAPKVEFLAQLALALSMAGQVLFGIGVGELTDYEAVPVAWALIGLEVALLLAYRLRLHRIISTLVIVGALLALVFDTGALQAVHVLIFGVAAGLTALLLADNKLVVAGLEALTRPVSFGLALALLGLALLPLFSDPYLWQFQPMRWPITGVLLLGVLLLVVARIALELGLGLRRQALPWLLAVCAALLIPTLRMPGILAALLVLALGFWRGQRLMLGLAAVFLVYYVGAYYYSLQWTLLVKSLALIGTGALLFGVRWALLRSAGGGGA